MRKVWILAAVTLLLLSANRGRAEEFLDRADIPSLVSGLRFELPMYFCGEKVPLKDPEIRERLEKEMLLTLWDRAQMILEIKRSGRYFPVIEKLLKENGLPDDLKYLAVVESALRPHAGSVKGAVGFWQFLKSTGRKYGLTINRRIDERRSIFTSTEAAIRFFKKLYAESGSWTLAAAGYNMGERGLQSAIKFQEIKDYYRLYIPFETQRYVFKALAVKLIMKNPEKYGFHLTHADLYPPLQFDRIKVKIKREVHLQTVAAAAGTYYKRIKDLNPQIRGRHLPKGSHVILVPEGAGGAFAANLKALVKKGGGRRLERVYVVRRGDSLSQIADRFKVPLSSLLAWNGLSASKPIHPGDRLVIHPK